MGVHGLWRLIEPSGKPVPLESLENKVLAVDVSIWLHQIIKGFQDSKGATVPNAHLLGIYHRVCKLLYFRIKPIFVFDGGVPVLKKNTIALRHQQKQKNITAADHIHKNLLTALIKHSAISKVLSEQAKAAIAESTSPTKSKNPEDDLYVLPPSQLDSTVSSDDSDSQPSSSKHFDLHSIDTESVEFKSLPADVRHEILTDLKETRKQSSWGRIHELPEESNDFSSYQMRRLLKRQSVQTALEQVEKEMGGHSLSLGELEKILKDQGVISNMKGNRIASDENTRFLLIKDIKLAMEEAKKNLAAIEEAEDEKNEETTHKNKGAVEYEDDLKRAIALSLEEVPSTSKEEEPSTSVKKIGSKGKNRIPLSFLSEFEDADFGDSESSEEEEFRSKLTPAQRYMMEYSGLTSHAIAKIIDSKSKGSKKISWEEENAQKDEVIKVQPVETTNIKVSEESKLKTPEETVEIMSDSGSSHCDDFIDVEINKESSAAMEVVIKPEEELEDDLFKDVFEDQDDTIPKGILDTQDKVKESIKQFVSATKDDEKEQKEDKNHTTTDLDEKSLVKTNVELNFQSTKQEQVKVDDNEPASSESTEKVEFNANVGSVLTSSKSTSQSTVEKIENMIKTYSKPKENEKGKLSVEQLNEMKENLRKEQSDLVAEKSSKERLAGNITDQMCQEAQELLELFGVPYIVAPMEAEAQCAFLDLIELTDGTITDDSDIWLFGGRTVYKNFFDQKKLVMEFRSESIHHHYKLTREQMILLAMLVGSDYTTGLTGVGPVTALEILAAFPPKNHLVSGLAEFKSWCSKGKLPSPGKNSLRGKLKNVKFVESFPNPKIVQAYLEPTVETSKEKFSWGKLDVPGLIDFAKRKFGWTTVKSEEILGPILRRLEDSRVQRSITDYFKTERKVETADGKAEKLMSKRVKTAVERIAKGNGDTVEDTKQKKRATTKKTGGPRSKKSKNEEIILKETEIGGPRNKKSKDEEIRILEETEVRSKERIEAIEKEVREEINKKEKVNFQRLHRKEVIPQRQRDKSEILRNKLKAIETFRKSKQGPGYVKKRGKPQREAKSDAGYLSEGSSSD